MARSPRPHRALPPRARRRQANSADGSTAAQPRCARADRRGVSRLLSIALGAAALLALAGAAAAAGARQPLAKPVGWGPLTSAEAAKRVHRSAWEPRPDNRAADHSRAGPRAAGAVARRAATCLTPASSTGGFVARRTRSFSGLRTSGGFDPRLLRAVAVVESWWHQSAVGDNGDSFGLFQVRRPYHCWGECRIARDSTAFNADYYGGILRRLLRRQDGMAEHRRAWTRLSAGRRVGKRRGLVCRPVVDRPGQGIYPRRSASGCTSAPGVPPASEPRRPGASRDAR